ncbi:MAG: mechanosensitive ion channel family protein, partial [Nocardioidaceae bacterium]
MSLLDLASTCNKGDHWCTWVYGATGNSWLAAASDWLIAKPFAVIVLFVIAVVIRWVMHRLIDRLVGRAATGLPTPILRRRRDGENARRLGTTVAAGRRVQRANTMGSLLK